MCVYFRVGDWSKVSLWESSLWGNTILIIIFSNLYIEFLSKKNVSSIVMEYTRGEVHWDLFRRNLQDWILRIKTWLIWFNKKVLWITMTYGDDRWMEIAFFWWSHIMRSFFWNWYYEKLLTRVWFSTYIGMDRLCTKKVVLFTSLALRRVLL